MAHSVISRDHFNTDNTDNTCEFDFHYIHKYLACTQITKHKNLSLDQIFLLQIIASPVHLTNKQFHTFYPHALLDLNISVPPWIQLYRKSPRLSITTTKKNKNIIRI